MERAYVLPGLAGALGLCLVLSGCSNGEEERRADCAKISSGRSILKDQFRRARISGSAADTRPR
ncbi:MAG TPA: hypothetical protein VKY91_05030 [Vulgatibacteraceae bacterium]|nr:hypothetical protein [Vulgatibacteraceae bacterium]